MLTNIKEITELKDYQEVNKRLKEEWQILKEYMLVME